MTQDHFNLVDLDAVADPLDKHAECKFFMALIETETDRQHIRWLISAFFSAANSFFDIAGRSAFMRFNDPETGDAIANEFALNMLRPYVKVTPDKRVAARYNSAPKHQTIKELRDFRNANSHISPIPIMISSTELPVGFELGHVRGKGKPALAFCRQVMDLIDKVSKQLVDEL